MMAGFSTKYREHANERVKNVQHDTVLPSPSLLFTCESTVLSDAIFKWLRFLMVTPVSLLYPAESSVSAEAQA